MGTYQNKSPHEEQHAVRAIRERTTKWNRGG